MRSQKGKGRKIIKLLYNTFDMIFEAVKKVCEVNADLIFLQEEDCDEAWGFTQKNDDGTFLIGINENIPLKDSLEIIAHEAAHIMAKSHDKPKGKEHDEEWEMWFENIHNEYCSLFEQAMNEKKGKVKHERRTN